MDSREIKTLIDAMAASGLSEMEFSRDGWTLRMVRAGRRVEAPELPQTPAAPAPDTDTGIQTAPLAGVLHLTPSPGEPPFAPVGAQIAVGATVAIIEAMKVFIEVKAEVAGIVQAVLASAGSDVAAGQALFRLV